MAILRERGRASLSLLSGREMGPGSMLSPTTRYHDAEVDTRHHVSLALRATTRSMTDGQTCGAINCFLSRCCLLYLIDLCEARSLDRLFHRAGHCSLGLLQVSSWR